MSTRPIVGSRVHIIIDRPLGSRHPKWGFRYPVNYGYVLGSLGKDGEPIDAYVLGIDEPLKEFKGTCIAVIHRLQDEDKLVVAPEGRNYSDEQIEKMTGFQEKHFSSIIIRSRQTSIGRSNTCSSVRISAIFSATWKRLNEMREPP